MNLDASFEAVFQISVELNNPEQDFDVEFDLMLQRAPLIQDMQHKLMKGQLDKGDFELLCDMLVEQGINPNCWVEGVEDNLIYVVQQFKG